VDPEGRVAVHTGSRCISHAGHVVGEGWAVLGNLLASERVVDAMAEVFPRARGTLAERMVATLEVAQENGGDIRGVQSAAIRIAPGRDELEEGFEAGIDFSVPDHPDPIAELRRLITVDRAYRALRRGQTALADGKEALALHHLSLAERLPHGVELDFWRALALFELGKVEAASETMAAVLGQAPQFEEVLRRLAEVDPVARRLRESGLH